MIELVICGFQTGADLAGARAAHAANIATGGFKPRGYLTEHGPTPEYRLLYGAREHESTQYPPRTRANVEWADITLWFGKGDSSGYWCTRNAAQKALKPFLEIETEGRAEQSPDDLAQIIRFRGYRIVNIAGTRESKAPGIGAWVEKFLTETFVHLKEPTR